MRVLLIILSIINVQLAFSQPEETKLISSMKEFHQALVTKNTMAIERHTHKGMSYGHSNGWLETKPEMISNLQTGVISYSKFKEDSVSVNINKKIASVRFIGDITATLNGKTADYHLKVLEVWVKKSKGWVLFARQALK